MSFGSWQNVQESLFLFSRISSSPLNNVSQSFKKFALQLLLSSFFADKFLLSALIRQSFGKTCLVSVQG